MSTIVTGGSAFDVEYVLRQEMAALRSDLALSSSTGSFPRPVSEAIDASPNDTAALCLSGGGIRSATFALGVIQALARCGLLEQFHYLSTVSGGGYIGSWLSAWRVTESDSSITEALGAAAITGTEAGQIKGIRADSNYITPQLGLLSPDTWSVIALYIRNLVLNWLMFLPFFTGCLLFPQVCATLLVWANQESTQAWVLIWLAGGAAFSGFGLTMAVVGRCRMRGNWLTRTRFLWLVLVPLVASAALFTVAMSAAHALPQPTSALSIQRVIAVGSTVGAMTYALAWLLGRTVASTVRLRLPKFDIVYWACAGALVGGLIALAIDRLASTVSDFRLLVVAGLSICVMAYLFGEVLYIGIASAFARGDIDREWLARSSGWLGATALSWALVASISLYAPDLFLHIEVKHRALGVGGISGLVTGWLGSSKMTAATKAAQVFKKIPLLRIVSLAAVVFAVVLAAVLSEVGFQLAEFAVDAFWPIRPVITEATLSILLMFSALAISWFVNVNRFSMHALYRNRLVRAFLGSARDAARQPDPFTGFDEHDNIRLTDTKPRESPNRLFHVINATLNVVSFKNPAWQERKAQSFTFSRQHCGNPYVGYRDAAQYGDGVTLGTAMAISGAAVSPNQGYNSSPLVAFLLMLFNIRLGWWFGNPRERTAFHRSGPTLGITPALRELAGATSDHGKWIYLSDGGHFENLGLYEMIRRRCRFIVVSDAGCDPNCSFEDLGNAVRKIYIDFGVSIDFKTLALQPRQNPPRAGVRCQ